MTNIPNDKLCTVGGCTRSHYARGLCRRHYLQWSRVKDKFRPDEHDKFVNDRLTNAPNPICTVDGCQRTRVTSRFCNFHLQRSLNPDAGKSKKKPCKISGCKNLSKTRGMCNKHYQAWFRAQSKGTGRLPDSV